MQFQMWEMNPKGNAEFTIDGSHIGTISNDLKTINAVWTTAIPEYKGTLKLKANLGK